MIGTHVATILIFPRPIIFRIFNSNQESRATALDSGYLEFTGQTARGGDKAMREFKIDFNCLSRVGRNSRRPAPSPRS